MKAGNGKNCRYPRTLRQRFVARRFCRNPGQHPCSPVYPERNPLRHSDRRGPGIPQTPSVLTGPGGRGKTGQRTVGRCACLVLEDILGSHGARRGCRVDSGLSVLYALPGLFRRIRPVNLFLRTGPDPGGIPRHSGAAAHYFSTALRCFP